VLGNLLLSNHSMTLSYFGTAAGVTLFECRIKLEDIGTSCILREVIDKNEYDSVELECYWHEGLILHDSIFMGLGEQ